METEIEFSMADPLLGLDCYCQLLPKVEEEYQPNDLGWKAGVKIAQGPVLNFNY